MYFVIRHWSPQNYSRPHFLGNEIADYGGKKQQETILEGRTNVYPLVN
jgi:hypothetical protein